VNVGKGGKTTPKKAHPKNEAIGGGGGTNAPSLVVKKVSKKGKNKLGGAENVKKTFGGWAAPSMNNKGAMGPRVRQGKWGTGNLHGC